MFKAEHLLAGNPAGAETVRAISDAPGSDSIAEKVGSGQRWQAGLSAGKLLLDLVVRFAVVWLVCRIAIAIVGFRDAHGTEPLNGPLLLVFCAVSVGGIFATSISSEARSWLPLSRVSKLKPRAWLCSFLAGWLLAGAIQLNGEPPPILELSLCSILVPAVWWTLSVARARLPAQRESRILVLGDGDLTAVVIERIARHGGGRCRVIGRVSDSSELATSDLPILGFRSELPQILREYAPDLLVVAFAGCKDAELLDVVRACDDESVELAIVPRLYEVVGQTSSVAMIGDIPMIQVPRLRVDGIGQAGKRVTDLVLGGLISALLSPLMLIVALAVMIDDGRPVLYKQRRIGRRGKPFRILKFRTMCRDADEKLAAWRAAVIDGTMSVETAVSLMKPDVDPRVTRIGRFLRATSLDELPQLLNVLQGTMSLVGPRPLCEYEVSTLSKWQQARQMVRPGITGSWQVQGRSNVEWSERMQLDYAYVRHWNAWNDLRILAATMPAVLRREGAR